MTYADGAFSSSGPEWTEAETVPATDTVVPVPVATEDVSNNAIGSITLPKTITVGPNVWMYAAAGVVGAAFILWFILDYNRAKKLALEAVASNEDAQV